MGTSLVRRKTDPELMVFTPSFPSLSTAPNIQHYTEGTYHVSMGLFWTGFGRVLVQELVYL